MVIISSYDVFCEDCDEYVEVKCNLNFDDFISMEPVLPMGWVRKDDGECFCNDCKGK